MRTQITPPTRTLLIDNHDSYTFNLYQLIAKVNGGANSSIYASLTHGSSPLHKPCWQDG